MKFLQLNFLPRSPDFALLVLRLSLGLTMIVLHGWVKLSNFHAYSEKFSSFMGLSPTVSLALAILGELGGALLVVLGLFTRLGAFLAAFTMGVAFFVAHGAKLGGQGSGEMAYLYLAGFAVIFIAGGGRFSFDGKSGE